MRRPRLAGAMAVLVSTATAVACGDDASESREVTTREPVVVGTGEFTNYNTSIAAGGPKGEVVTVVWNDYDDVQVVERPFVVTSADGGATFSKPVLIDPDDPYLAYPELAVDDAGTIFAAVTRYADGDADGWPALYASTDGGSTFDRLADLPDAPSIAFCYTGASVAVSPDGSDVVLSWGHASEGPDDVSATYAVVSADGGRTFGPPQLVTEIDDTCLTRVQSFASAEALGVATPLAIPIPGAPEPTPANPDPVDSTPSLGVALAGSDGMFGEPIEVEQPGDLAGFQGPGAARAGSTTHEAWWGSAEGIGTLWYATADDGDFGEPTPLLEDVALADPSTGSATAVELIVDGRGTVWALASVMVDDTPEIRLIRVVDGKPEVIDAASAPRLSSGIEYDLAPRADGGVALVWLDGKDVLVRVVEG